MNKNPKVSIIVPCFNDEKFVETAINSAFSQTYPHKEIVVVNDGSDQRTRNVLEKLESKIDKLIHQPNLGTSAARNHGIKMATGDFILTLDSDDYFESQFCSKAVKILQERGSVRIVTCFAQRFKGSHKMDIFRPKSGGLEDFLKYNHALGTALFRREDWKVCGGYDESMKSGYEDWEFYIRLLALGGTSEVIPEILFHYRFRSQSNSSRAIEKKYDLLKYIYLKHKSLYISHYEDFVTHLLSRLAVVEKAEKKNLTKPEFKIGSLMLKPIRLTIKFWNNLQEKSRNL